ncbi:MAG: hypothetical protein HY567_00510 [Candidatus Kerfeldbacteria bacterium]|nr:hypothetical protein [Candidatus Kerfeldbacteria bacterium]
MNHPADQPRGKPAMLDRQFKRNLQTARRLYLAGRIFSRRHQFEQELVLRGQEPRFRVSWEKLSEIAEHPRALAGGFGKFIHRLHRLARSETDEAVRAYHAVSRPQPAAINEPPREEL